MDRGVTQKAIGRRAHDARVRGRECPGSMRRRAEGGEDRLLEGRSEIDVVDGEELPRRTSKQVARELSGAGVVELLEGARHGSRMRRLRQ